MGGGGGGSFLRAILQVTHALDERSGNETRLTILSHQPDFGLQ